MDLGLLHSRDDFADTHFRLRLSWTTQVTLSQRQFPQGAPSTTSHRTFLARHDTHARAARRFVILAAPADSVPVDSRFLVRAVSVVEFIAVAPVSTGDPEAGVLLEASGESAGTDPAGEADRDSESLSAMVQSYGFRGPKGRREHRGARS